MGFTDVVLTIFAATLSGSIVAWLFSSKEQQMLTADRVKKFTSLSFRILVLFMGGLGMFRCIYAFVQFANSKEPISRIEIVELLVFSMNFLIFLVATTLFAAIWRHLVLEARKKIPAETGPGNRGSEIE